jgi:hypothetical protein
VESADASSAVLPTTGTGAGNAATSDTPTGGDASVPVSRAAGDAAPASDPASGAGAAAAPSADDNSNSANGGCQIGARINTGSGGALIAMLLLALGVAIGRRRLAAATDTH